MQLVRDIRLGFAAFLAVLGAAALALMSFCVKYLPFAMPSSEILFFRFLISFVLLVPVVLFKRDFTFKIQTPWLYLLRIFAGLAALVSLFVSIKYLPLVDVLLLVNTAPLFLPIIVFLALRIKTGKFILFSIVIGFLGVILVLKPGHELFKPIDFLPLAGGLFAAIGILSLRILTKKHPARQLLFYYFLVCTVVMGLISIFQWYSPSLQDWLLLLGVGVFGAFYQFLITVAYAYGQVRFISPIMYFSVVLGGVLDWLLWQQIPGWQTIIGSLIVILAASCTVYLGHQTIK